MKIDTLYVIGCEFPTQPLGESTAAHPLLHSRLTELQVHTLFNLDFSAHEVWTRAEVYALLDKVAKDLNPTARGIARNLLSDDGAFHHYAYVHPKGRL
jgi:hypothetical protein